MMDKGDESNHGATGPEKAWTDDEGDGQDIEQMAVVDPSNSPDGGGGNAGKSADAEDWGPRQIFKNLLVICTAFLLLFTAFGGLSNLQSSINCDQGLGLASLATIYATLILSALFLPSGAIRLLGMKWTLVASILAYAVYTAANFYPGWATLIPTSALVGLAAAPLWAAKSTYLTTVARRYAALSANTANAIVNRFFGVFFLFFQTSQVLGNLVSSLLLRPQGADNGTSGEFVCGAGDCPVASNASGYCEASQNTVTFTLIAVYLASALAAMAVVIIFLDKLQTSSRTQSEKPCQLVMASIRLMKDYRMLLLIPLTMYSGLEQAFISGEFTKSYVTCTVGVSWVGYVMICYGVTDALCSLLAGRLVKHVGRIPLFTFAALLHMCLIVTLLFWSPSKDQLVVCFLIAAFWGAADAVWQTQVNSLYGVLFPSRQEAAFSNYRLWESVGFTLSFAYSNFVCVRINLIVLASVLAVGIAFYYLVELGASRREGRGDEETKVDPE